MYKKGVVCMFNKKEFVDPKKIMLAHLAKLTDDDLEINKLDNVNIRCTNESYIVGELGKTKDNVPIFLDVMNDDVETISLEVRKSNHKAIALYQKYGFLVQAVRPDYYQDNHEDAYLMTKRREKE